MTTPATRTTPTPAIKPTAPAVPATLPQLIRDADHLRTVLDIPFSDEQMAAIQAPTDSPSAIIAGAGSGKTTVMAARVVWLVGHEGVLPGEILGLTFTNKAASELGHRVRQALETLARDAGVTDLLERYGTPTVSTYHAYAGTLITEYGLLLGFEPDLRITTDASRFQRAFRAIASYPGSLTYATTSMPDLIGNVLALDGQMAEHLVAPDDVRRVNAEMRVDVERATVEMRKVKLHDQLAETTHRRDELVTLVERYRETKAADGVVDFSDQMERGARLALECPEVSRSQRERFAVVLLDEYQDTSVAQRDMLRGLFSGEQGEGLGHCVTAVGDPCQGIYGWRGAAASNLTAFLDDFPADPDRLGAARTSAPDQGTLFHLRVNRRSRREILDVANRLAAPYYALTEVVRPLVPAEGTAGGTVRAALHETVADEVAWLVDEVVSARTGGGRTPATPWSEIAILVRTRSEIPTVVAALRDKGVPVEVVGLTGLLAQPEVTDVLAVLRVLADQTANAALLRLLTGPRWRIGPRDLALLGRRARMLVGGVHESPSDSLTDELERSVRGTDPAEIVSLADAVESPDDEVHRLPYSDEARARFGELARMLRRLRRRASGSPADTARLAVAALGIDVELASTPGTAARVAQDNITRLLDVIADAVATDPSASLAAVLAYLDAEERYNGGLEVASPSDSDAVKLLTVHTAKGLEWDVVLVPFLTADVFPSTRSRSAWPTSAQALPHDLRGDGAELPVMHELSRAGDKEFRAAMRADAQMEEIRLGYVAFTRARRLLITSGSRWSRTRKQPSAPSPFLETVAGWLRGQGSDAELWVPEPDDDADNPMLATAQAVAWPVAPDPAATAARRAVADTVRHYVAEPPEEQSALPGLAITAESPDLESAQLARLSTLDEEIERLLTEAQGGGRTQVEVPLPPNLSTTALMAMQSDPEAFARSLVRPMPRPPSQAARFGTRFHARIEALFGQQVLFGDDDLPGRHEHDIDGEVDLDELVRAFEAGPMGGRVPYAIEEPFTIRLGGQLVNGRIDAVYRTESGFDVVDWKTNRRMNADPLQLAVYRLAWAEKHGVDPARVTGSFHYVRVGETVTYEDLPDRAELEHLVDPTASDGSRDA